MIWLIPLIGTAATALGGAYLYADATESPTEAAGLTGADALEFQRLEANIAAANARRATTSTLLPYAAGAAAVAGIAYALRDKK